MSGYDACIIGSGAGGGPVAATLAEAGYRVAVLERGPWFDRDQFLKDEIAMVRRPLLWPDTRDAPHVWEYWDNAGNLRAKRTGKHWNGSMVGGASVLMSGFFLRMKPADFRMRSIYGDIPDADVADWPISYDDLEPYYARAEAQVPVSGMVTELPEPIADRRSTPEFPQVPTEEHPFAQKIDEACTKAGLHPFPTPRAVLSSPHGDRKDCSYSGYCATYGCTTGAKGSSLESFLPRALKTGRCDIIPRAQVTKLESDAKGNVVRARYVDRTGAQKTVEASIFVVACQAIESARLLLNSSGPKHPNGLANRNGLVGRNLLFSTFGAASVDFSYAKHGPWLRSKETFINRTLQDWYFIDDPKLGKRKGGTIDFIPLHPNPIARAYNQATKDPVKNGVPHWGRGLKQRLRRHFRETTQLKVEAFGEWHPNAWCRVTLDPAVKDKWGIPAARVNHYSHIRNRETIRFLMDRGAEVVRLLGGESYDVDPGMGGPSTNLVGGTCRFGDDPSTSVLDRDCRAHDARNLFVTDASFMPSGGSVPFTFTIYANALRVADKIVAQLGGPK